MRIFKDAARAYLVVPVSGRRDRLAAYMNIFMNKKNYFSENLAYARKLKGFRQHELADWIGVRPNTISNYEKGVSEPDYDTLGKLKAFLEVSADDLVFAQPEKFKEIYVVVNPGSVPMYEVKTLKKRYNKRIGGNGR